MMTKVTLQEFGKAGLQTTAKKTRSDGGNNKHFDAKRNSVALTHPERGA